MGELVGDGDVVVLGVGPDDGGQSVVGRSGVEPVAVGLSYPLPGAVPPVDGKEATRDPVRDLGLVVDSGADAWAHRTITESHRSVAVAVVRPRIGGCQRRPSSYGGGSTPVAPPRDGVFSRLAMPLSEQGRSTRWTVTSHVLLLHTSEVTMSSPRSTMSRETSS